ncbi:MAG: hypothetical protein QXU39_01035 [Candidatus Pacearchaeota archaeon]
MVKFHFSPKKILGILAAVFLFGGFLLLDKGISGNVIFEGNSYSMDTLSMIGLAIIIFSAILSAYIIIKDNKKVK